MFPSKLNNKNLFLKAAEDHDLARCCRGFLKGNFVDEEGNKTQKFENIVKPLNEFEDESHLLRARSPNDFVEDVMWV